MISTAQIAGKPETAPAENTRDRWGRMRAMRAAAATAKMASTQKWKPEKAHSLGDSFEYRGSVFDNPWLMTWGAAIATLSALLSYGCDPDRASSE